MDRQAPPTRELRWVFLAAGALAIAVQVGLLRELTVDLAGDETAIGLGLGAWLAGIALGAWVVRRRVTAERCGQWASVGLPLLVIAGVLGVVAGRILRWALAPAAGELIDVERAVVVALVTLTPGGICVGATFTALAGVAVAGGSGAGIARLYVWESLGSLVAGLLVSVALPSLAPLTAIVLVSVACLAAVAPAGRAGVLPGGRVFLLAALVLAGCAPFAPALDRALERVRFAGVAPGIPLESSRHTPYEHLAIGGGDVRHLYVSGQYAASFPDPTTSETLAHTVACFAPRVDRVLALGGLETGALRFLLEHPVSRVTVVQPDRRGREFVESWLPAEDRKALADPRVEIVTDDPRRFLARGGAPYDLIVLLGPDPLTLMRARFTTVEFNRLCAERLAGEGVLVESLKTAPNVLTAETAALAGSLQRSLSEVFPVVRATPGPEGFLIGAMSPRAATLDPEVLAARWRERGIASRVFVPELFPLLFPTDRVRAQEDALARAAGTVAASRDDRPVSFVYALARRQAISGGAAGRGLAALARVPKSALAVLALAPSLIALALQSVRRRRRGAAQHVVAATGAAGMTWSLLILFSFQTHVGALYGQLGLLTALFMSGLAAGGFAARRAAAAERDSGTGQAWLAVTSGLALAYAVALPFALPAVGRVAGGGWVALVGHGALQFLAGLVTGGVFPAGVGALLAVGLPPTECAGRIEAVDHWGAALAALTGALLFIPLFGIGPSAWIVAALEAVAFTAVVLARDPR